MTDAEFIADRIRALEDSVTYFSSKNKAAREHWVANKFLRALRLRFADTAIKNPPSDPPDVLFREAQFEIKEILDPDRPRHKEFKEALNLARQATDPNDLLEEFTSKRMNPQQIAEKIHLELGQISNHYAPAVRQSLDLLFYVNLRDCYFEPGTMPAPETFAVYGWRSISAYENAVGLVFFAGRTAPRFLRTFSGRYSSRKGVLHDGI